MKFHFFDFTNSKHKHNYLEMIEAEDVRELVSNFFEPTTLQFIHPKIAKALVKAINRDIKNEIFDLKTNSRTNKTIVNSYNTMNSQQLNSKTHQLFLKAIAEGFGKSAAKTLKERKNLNIFNLTEIHVLHQEIFNKFGASFVNRILNNDLTPQSLIIIKNILSNKQEMNNFKYFYDFYTKNIGEKQTDFERMIRSYEQYKELIADINTNKHKLSAKQKETLADILTDKDNRYNISSVSDIDNFYKTKNDHYFLEKRKAKSLYKDGSEYFMSAGIDTLSNSIFRNYFGVEACKYYSNFSIMDRNPFSICKYFDLDEIIKRNIDSPFTSQELEMLEDMKKIVDATYSVNQQESFETLLQMADKYEKKGNTTSVTAFRVFDKIPQTFGREILDSLSTINLIEKRAKSKEKGISIEKHPLTEKGTKVELPVYIFDGANFAFLSTTNYTIGLSGNEIKVDFAASWFEYENGTSHICCSYANQDKLSNLEFNRKYFSTAQVTYFFDDAEILTMGPRDIFTNESPRVSNVSSDESTKFMSSSKIAEESSESSYNEVGVNRYNYSGTDIEFGGKIIPSGILCCDVITDAQLNVARSFTKYCVEHGLKPEGWQMPIVIVKKERYLEIQKMKKKGLISKNSEYFMLPEEKKQQEIISKKTKEIKQKKVTTR